MLSRWPVHSVALRFVIVPHKNGFEIRQSALEQALSEGEAEFQNQTLRRSPSDRRQKNGGWELTGPMTTESFSLGGVLPD